MVKILPNGDIVPDNDPRASGTGSTGDRQPPVRQRRGEIQNDNQDPVAHMPQGSMFDALNQKLIDAGIPRWNIGPYTIEPIVSVGFLLALLFFGLPGLIFGGLLFLVSKWSQSGDSSGQGPSNSGFRGGGQGNTQGGGPNSSDHRWQGGGHRLGR